MIAGQPEYVGKFWEFIERVVVQMVYKVSIQDDLKEGVWTKDMQVLPNVNTWKGMQLCLLSRQGSQAIWFLQTKKGNWQLQSSATSCGPVEFPVADQLLDWNLKHYQIQVHWWCKKSQPFMQTWFCAWRK